MKEKNTNQTTLETAKSDLEALEQAVSQGSKLRLVKLTIRSGVKAGGPKPKPSVGCPQPLYGVTLDAI